MKTAGSLEPLAPVVAAALTLVARLLRTRRHESYEILMLAIKLDILDRGGRRAHLGREQEVRFLAEEAGVVRDLTWGEGIVSNHRAVGAELVDVRREGLKRVVWLGLPERPLKGELAMVRSDCTIRDGFRRAHEYFELEVERPTRLMSLTVFFPPERPAKEASLLTTPPVMARRHPRLHWDLGPKPYLQFVIKRPRPFTKYRLSWSW